jgi:hypothetical protein
MRGPFKPSFGLSGLVADPDPPLVSLGQPVIFSIFRVFCIPNGIFFNPKQNRHPERSAAQIYRITEGLCAKSKDPGDVCWQMLFQAFRPQTSIEIEKVTTSDRRESEVERPAVSAHPATNPKWKTLLSPHLQRNRGICNSADHSWKCVFERAQSEGEIAWAPGVPAPRTLPGEDRLNVRGVDINAALSPTGEKNLLTVRWCCS